MRTQEKKILSALQEHKKVVILYGARQIGKTTLMKRLATHFSNHLFLNAELPKVQEVLETKNPEIIKIFFGEKEYIFIDEAQKIQNIGQILKILYDECPEYHIMVTGSSSFELSASVHEPLTGRNKTFFMYPLSVEEWKIENELSLFDLHNQLDSFLRFGMYPAVLNASSEQEKIDVLAHLSSDYLYQDVLQFERLKNPKMLRKLLQALAWQLGSEVSYHELAQLLKTSSATVEHYIDLLEKAFVIFALPAFSTNPRKEISKKQKIYFYDIGIRNAIIDSFQGFEKRNDKGACWENFCVVEQKKYAQKNNTLFQEYFWRSYSQKEVDYLQVQGEEIRAFEYKAKEGKMPKAPLLFRELYPHASFFCITPDTLFSRIL